jgi:hypothetical protein
MDDVDGMDEMDTGSSRVHPVHFSPWSPFPHFIAGMNFRYCLPKFAAASK